MSEEKLMPPTGLGGVVYGTDATSHQHEYRVANGPWIIIKYCIKCGKCWSLGKNSNETSLVWQEIPEA